MRSLVHRQFDGLRFGGPALRELEPTNLGEQGLLEFGLDGVLVCRLGCLDLWGRRGGECLMVEGHQRLFQPTEFLDGGIPGSCACGPFELGQGGASFGWAPALLREELLRDELLPLTRTPAIFADVLGPSSSVGDARLRIADACAHRGLMR